MPYDRELREIEMLIAARSQTDHDIANAIRRARDGGATWEEIGKALGLQGRQAGYQWLKRYEEREGIR